MVAIATIVIGCTPSFGAKGISVTDMMMPATLNIAGDSAGTKKCPREFSIPMNTAATATSVRNGVTMRARKIVSSSFPGTPEKLPAYIDTSGLAKMIARTTITAVTMTSALMTELASRHDRSRPCKVSWRVNVGMKAALIAPSANRSRTRFGMRLAMRKASLASPAPK